MLQAHLKASLEALWSNSEGSWEKLMVTLNEELGKQVGWLMMCFVRVSVYV